MENRPFTNRDAVKLMAWAIGIPIVFAILLVLFDTKAEGAEWAGFEAVTRVSYTQGVGRSTGSGTVFEKRSDGSYSVLTNAHVVGRQSRVQIEFFRHIRFL